MSATITARTYVVGGVPGSGKTTLVWEKFLKDRPRVLVITSNRYDPGWNHVKYAIDPDAICKKISQGEFRNCRTLYKSNSKEARAMRMELEDAISREVRTFKGVRKVYLPSHRATAREILEILVDEQLGFLNGEIVFDDCRNYISSANMEDYIQTYVRNRRHFRVHSFFMIHGPKDISSDVVNLKPGFILFATEGNWDNFKHKFNPARYEQILRTANRCNAIGADIDTDAYYQQFLDELKKDKQAAMARYALTEKDLPYISKTRLNMGENRQHYMEFVAAPKD